MNTTAKAFIVVALVLAVGAVFAVKHYNTSSEEDSGSPVEVTRSPGQSQDMPNPEVSSESEARSDAATGLPRLVDLGADKCIPCKMMAPILEELKTEYAGQLQVDFFDVWKDPSAAEHYGVKIIPTQIFYDPDGKELFRHVGFFSKDDILAKWKELGVTLPKDQL
jgi:thioredoxin 1